MEGVGNWALRAQFPTPSTLPRAEPVIPNATQWSEESPLPFNPVDSEEPGLSEFAKGNLLYF